MVGLFEGMDAALYCFGVLASHDETVPASKHWKVTAQPLGFERAR